ALGADAEFYGTSASLQLALPPALEGHGMALLKLISASRQLTSTRDAGAFRREFALAARGALEASRTLWGVAASELEKLLEIRSASLARESALALLVVAAALAFRRRLAWRILV